MLTIKNWSSYQSYKDRKPPWIRLHRSLIDNYEFQCMSANARALLPMLWLLACEDEDPLSGNVPYSFEKISFRLRLSLKEIESGIKEICSAGFAELNQSCNETVTKPLLKRIQDVTPETETETETETEKQGGLSPSIFRPPKLSEVAEYCQERENSVCPSEWWDFYASKGWMIGKNKMKDWKAAVRTWERNSKNGDIKNSPFVGTRLEGCI